MSWVKAIAIVTIVFGMWQGLQILTRHSGGPTSIGANLSNDVSAAELAQLAANVNADEVMIYTTTQCPYCKQAKAWMNQYGFPFTECDAQVRSECAHDLDSFGSDGVPYLIVRGKHLKDGFNSNEFIAALRQDAP
jgi:glutaredoxin